MDLSKLDLTLRDACHVDPGKLLVLGFSGGPDSLALLHALHALGCRLLAAHLDHGLRLESAQDAKAAEQLAAAIGVRFVAERVDVGKLAKERKMSIEEAAREERYTFLFRIAEQEDAQAVAVAHTADDQTETVMMHLLRGAGPAGLRGMAPQLLPNPWSNVIPLVRPFLGVWRKEIEAYCKESDLTPLLDSSNLDKTFFRNRLRHELLPLMEDLVPGVKARLLQTGELLVSDYAYVESQAAAAWQRCLAHRAENYLALDRAALSAQPLPLQRLLLRRAVVELRPQQRDLDFGDVQRGLEFLRTPSSRPVDWVAGLYLLVERDLLWVADWEAELPIEWPLAPPREVEIKIPAIFVMDDHWRLQILEEVGSPDLLARIELNNDTYQAWIDADAAGDKLTLCRPRPGDRFQPLGLEDGSIKLSDLFVNEKLTARARETWQLVCKGKEIVWVPGSRIAHAYRVRSETKRLLHLQLFRVF